MDNRNGASGAAVFVQTNEVEANRLLVFGRDPDGRLSPPQTIETGGNGDGIPHLTSQGSLVLTQDAKHLLVVNAGSDELSLFQLGGEPSLLQVVPTGGRSPKSVAEHAGLVYVLNADSPSLAGFRLVGDQLEPLEGSVRDLAPDADPAQVGFSPDGSTLVVTERGTNAILVCPVAADGLLADPVASPSVGPTPYGFAFTPSGALIVTEAFGAEKGKAAASSYRLLGDRVEPISRSIGNGRSEICWAVTTNDGRHVYATNFADGAVSRYAVGEDGSITLDEAVAGSAVEGKTGLRDEDLTADGRFLYAIDADTGRVLGWHVGDRELNPVGSWETKSRTIAGLAAS